MFDLHPGAADAAMTQVAARLDTHSAISDPAGDQLSGHAPPHDEKVCLGCQCVHHHQRTEFNAGKFAPYVGDDVRIDIAIEAVAP